MSVINDRCNPCGYTNPPAPSAASGEEKAVTEWWPQIVDAVRDETQDPRAVLRAAFAHIRQQEREQLASLRAENERLRSDVTRLENELRREHMERCADAELFEQKLRETKQEF